MNYSSVLIQIAISCFGFIVAYSEPDGEWFSRYDENIYLDAAKQSSQKSAYQNRVHKYHTSFPDPIGCKMYLAESSVTDSGLGMYTGVDVKKGEIVGESDIPIQIIDVFANNEDNEDIASELIGGYVWHGVQTGALFEATGVNTVMPPFGMAANSYLAQVNVDSQSRDKDFTSMDRTKNPGAGAVTDYTTQAWAGKKDISKGSELFVNYGENYFMNDDKYPGLPLPDNFEEADEIVRQFHIMITNKKIEPDTVDKLWDVIEFSIDEDKHRSTKRRLNEIISNNTEFDRDTIKASWKVIKKSLEDERTKNALPRLVDLEQAANTGTSLYLVPNMIRPISWLEEHGQCMDHLKIQPSTISGAGRGAFAKRFIRDGALVAPAPLVHILNRDLLNMYELEEDEDEDDLKKMNDLVIGEQLLLNYCFGHPNSSLVLFPYSQGVQFLNHDSTYPNAEIRWSNSVKHHDEWLELELGELPYGPAGLMFDVVALRDIYPGEEVFIDYGREWEEAWDNHKDEWNPVSVAYHSFDLDNSDVLNDDHSNKSVDDHKYESANDSDDDSAPVIVTGNVDELNKDPQSVLRTRKEEKKYPYPRNVHTSCYYEITGEKDQVKDGNYPSDEDHFNWVAKADLFDGWNLNPCHIRSRFWSEKEDKYFYDVELFKFFDELSDKKYIVHNVARKAIKFIEPPYQSSQHLKNAFRHHIGVPEGTFPKTWLNSL